MFVSPIRESPLEGVAISMRYRNPPLPSGHVHQDETREFVVLLSAAAAILVLLVGVAVLLGGWFAPMIPFAAERSLVSGAEQVFDPEPAAPGKEAVRAELSELAARITAVMDLPEGMTITVHYVDSPTVNAVATLGGNVVVFRGLIEKVDNEEMLAAVLAHEIGHVRERHVITAMGRGVALAATLNAIGIKSRGLSRWAMGQTGQLAALTYSRDAEREADRAAVEATARLYGQVGGVIRLFELFEGYSDGGLEILKTHPLPATRLAEIRSLAQAQGFATEGEPHPLAPALAALSAAPPAAP